MALTGVEVAGVVLAVIPLCITLLEHHKSELEPFKVLFNYTKRAQKLCQDLRAANAEFLQVMQTTATDAGASLADLNGVFDGPRTTPQRYQDLEKTLTQHFGFENYLAFRHYVEKTQSHIVGISRILHLQIPEELDSNVVWISIENEKRRLAQPFKLGKTELTRRLKLIFRSGTLGPKKQEMLATIDRLTSMRTNARDLAPALKAQRVKFDWPLRDIRAHVKGLRRALQGVKTCPTHGNHPMNLHLDSRLSNTTRETAKTATGIKRGFTVALAERIEAKEWHVFDVKIEVEQTPDWRTDSRRVRFTTVQPVQTWQDMTGGICETIKHSLHVHFCVDDQHRLRKSASAPDSAVIALSEVERKTMKTLLESPGLDFGDSIDMGLTLASSFLQLYSTEWMTEPWSSDDITFLQHKSSTDPHKAYISLDRSHISGPSVVQGNTDFLALAAMLLELGTNKTIDECSRPEDGKDLLVTVSRCLDEGQLKSTAPCFGETIRYCLSRYATSDCLDIDGDITGKVEDIASALVHPFQRDLREIRKNAIVGIS